MYGVSPENLELSHKQGQQLRLCQATKLSMCVRFLEERGLTRRGRLSPWEGPPISRNQVLLRCFSYVGFKKRQLKTQNLVCDYTKSMSLKVILKKRNYFKACFKNLEVDTLILK